MFKIGKNVTGFKLGDRVVTHNSAPCGKCFFCKNGRNDGLCEDMAWIQGGHAEYCGVPGRIVKMNLFHIPDDVSYKAAALTEPFSCAVYGADMTPVSFNDTVVILGAGPIGLMIALLMKKKGARVIQADFSNSRLEISKKLGVNITVGLKDVEDHVATIRALTPQGRGADAVIDATGIPKAWENAIGIVRKAGFVNLFGGCKPGTSISVDTYRIHYDGIMVTGYFHTTPKHVKMANDMINNHEIPEDLFITKEYPFERLIEAIEAHANQDAVKNALVYN